MRLAMADGAFGRQLGAAVVRYRAFDQQVTGSAGFAVHSVKVVVFDYAGELPFVAFHLSMSFAGEVRSPIAIEASSCNRSHRQEHQGTNHHQPERFPHFHEAPPSEAGHYTLQTEPLSENQVEAVREFPCASTDGMEAVPGATEYQDRCSGAARDKRFVSGHGFSHAATVREITGL